MKKKSKIINIDTIYKKEREVMAAITKEKVRVDGFVSEDEIFEAYTTKERYNTENEVFLDCDLSDTMNDVFERRKNEFKALFEGKDK